MNERIKLLLEQARIKDNRNVDEDKFALLIINECRNAVLSVPCYYKDHKSKIEESIINDCADAVFQHFGIEE